MNEWTQFILFTITGVGLCSLIVWVGFVVEQFDRLERRVKRLEEKARLP